MTKLSKIPISDVSDNIFFLQKRSRVSGSRFSATNPASAAAAAAAAEGQSDAARDGTTLNESELMLALRQAISNNVHQNEINLTLIFHSRKAVRRRKERRRRKRNGRGDDGAAVSWPRRPRTSLTTPT